MSTRDDGFTLIELLVAMTLLAFLSLALVAGMRYGTNIFGKTQAKDTALNAARTAERIIAGNLSRLYPKYVTVSPTEAYVDFDGTQHAMSFFTTAEPETGFLMHDTLEAVRDGGTFSVRIATMPDLARNGGTTQTLLTRLSSVDFSYYGIAGDAKEPAWYSTWRKQAGPPQLVRIHVAASDPGATPRPDLILAPRIAA
ncbi:MAG TPA: type II secretion system protein, partial [Rhizomicrobium sp.]|nr:type II secretion system protein [Rhizomicrobium sp.]